MADPAAVRTVRETELKLTVPDGADLAAMIRPSGPIGAVGEPTTATLQTTYYDTEDLRLAREGITLRRRRGDDEGWHLKLPAAGGRDEVRTDPAAGAPPAVLRSLVRVYTRTAPIRRVTTMETTRTTRRLLGRQGELLGVLVDDRVRVLDGRKELSRFREIEVEAAPEIEDPAPLLRDIAGRLTAAGATLGEQMSKAVRALGTAAQEPPSPPRPVKVRRKAALGTVLTALLRSDTRELMLADLGVRRDLPDAAAALAAAAGQLAGTLRTVAPLLPAGVELIEELAALRTAAGAVVEPERLQRRLPAAGGALDLPDPAAVIAYLDERLSAELDAARATLTDRLDGRRHVRLIDRLTALASDPPLTAEADRRAGEALPELLASAVGALDGDRPAAGDDGWGEAAGAANTVLHLATFGAAVLPPSRKYTERIAALRDALAAYEAAAAVAAAARRLAPAAPPEVAFGLGMLAARGDADAERAAEQVATAWRAYGRASTRKDLVSLP